MGATYNLDSWPEADHNHNRQMSPWDLRLVPDVPGFDPQLQLSMKYLANEPLMIQDCYYLSKHHSDVQ